MWRLFFVFVIVIFMMFIFIFVLFFLEIAAFVEIGSEIGAFKVILWIIVSALFGMNRIKHYLLSMSAARSGNVEHSPADALFHGFVGIIGSALLIVPGFVSDFLGCLLLLPCMRTLLRELILDGFVGSYTFGLMDTDDLRDMKSHYTNKKQQKMSDPESVDQSHVVEADFEVVEKDEK